MEFSISSRAAGPALAKVNTKVFAEKEKEKREAIAVTSLSSSSLKELADTKKVATPIPMILHNDWSRNGSSAASSASSDSASEPPAVSVPQTLEEEAAQALLAEVSVKEAERQAALKKKPLPILMVNAVPGVDKLTTETDRFRHDVSMRPDDMTLEAYEERSVEDFGIGLLMGMGWKEGQGIGGKNRRVVEAIEFMPRGHLLGLGADPALPPPPDRKGRINKPGEEKEVVALRVAPDEEGKIRHFRTVNDRLIPVASLAMRVGALLEIVGGTHSGLFGRVVDIGDQSVEEARRVITVKLNLNEERVQVKRYDVQVIDPHSLPPGHPALTMGAPKPVSPPANSSSARKEDNSRKRPKPEVVSSGSDSDDDSSDNSSKKKKKKSKTSSSSSSSSKMWVQPNLHVRIISKSVGKGAFYNQKGIVVDVVSRSRFIVKMDESGRLLEDLKAKHVETVLPKAAGRSAQGSAGTAWPVKVMVLAMSRNDEQGLGVLLEKSNGKALVQLDQDMELVTVPFDRVCEYIQ